MKPKKYNSTSGFSLIEVMIAITIIAGGILVISTAWSGNTLRIRKAKLYTNVAHLLEKKMAELEAKYEGKPLEEIDDELSGNFGSEYPQYSWRFDSHELEMPNLSSILSPGEDGATNDTFITMIQKMTDFISESVKESTLTVIVTTKGGKSLEYPVTTYFVDYDKDIPLGL